VNDYIYEWAERLASRFQSHDPFEIARNLGIEVEYSNDLVYMKGMYAVVRRNRFIILNGNLSRQTLLLVCAHEFGHDQLHRKLAANRILQEFMLLDMASRPEYQANIFATDGQVVNLACLYSVTGI
jgi:Zn-dependent peptidase ImmA (M78 family)